MPPQFPKMGYRPVQEQCGVKYIPCTFSTETTGEICPTVLLGILLDLLTTSTPLPGIGIFLILRDEGLLA